MQLSTSPPPHFERIYISLHCKFVFKTYHEIVMYNRVIDNNWDFKTANTKEFTHCYHNYPAMMIPQVARKLLTDFAPAGKVDLVFDPYVGSGTTLVESSILGIKSVGTDLNPLARLISKVKCRHYSLRLIEDAASFLITEFMIYSDINVINRDFSRISNYSFWYSEENLLKLSYINQIINTLDPSVQDFFLVCLSETVREVSFTRNGEFKRYKMSEKQLSAFSPDVFAIFEKKVIRNIAGLKSFNHTGDSDLATIYNFNTTSGIPKEILSNESVDMIVTSPPYGDSHTTVAYGQFSRWSNEWFNFENAKILDRILMGGSICKDINLQTESLKSQLKQLKECDEKRYYEVSTFLNDYRQSINNVANVVRKGGRICYVVGNRRVKSIQIDLDYFTAEMFEKCGFRHDITIVREIPNKRMPSKNSPTNKAGAKADTMSNEYIVIMTKL